MQDSADKLSHVDGHPPFTPKILNLLSLIIYGHRLLELLLSLKASGTPSPVDLSVLLASFQNFIVEYLIDCFDALLHAKSEALFPLRLSLIFLVAK